MSACEEQGATPLSRSNLLRSWTPTTTQQLQDVSSCAFDVLDHVMENSSFVSKLSSELDPWLSQLKPARTQGDIQAAEILSLLQGLAMNTTPATSRGDENVFIAREDRTQADFSDKCPSLLHLISSVETTAETHLSHCITFDNSLTSVQLAIYPGDGASGYPRHCDSSTSCEKRMQRILTAVYYVTPDDWNAELDGGSLRVYLSNDSHHDVVPYSNRMVVFRSDTVDHQVMPSLRRPRMALTIWLYGKVKDDYSAPTRSLVANTNTKVSQPLESGIATTWPPPLDVVEAYDEKATIFVSIVAYRDSELGPTLTSLMATAQYPKRVFVGVLLQLDESADQSLLESLPREKQWFASQVKILSVEARHARGPCYARALCQRLYSDENYVLQTDSHMRFRPNWDSYLISQLKKCPSSKSMLTTYPVGYTLPNTLSNETRGTLLVPWKFDADGMLRQRGRLLQPRMGNVPCYLYAAGFNFSLGRVITDVPYDDNLQYLFFGEELSMAVRLYTHGYDLYAPPETVVYHLWSRSHRPTPIQQSISQETRHRQEIQRNAARQLVLQQLNSEGRDWERRGPRQSLPMRLESTFKSKLLVPKLRWVVWKWQNLQMTRLHWLQIAWRGRWHPWIQSPRPGLRRFSLP